MRRLLSRRLLGKTAARKAWLDVLDERLPRLDAPTTPAASRPLKKNNPERATLTAVFICCAIRCWKAFRKHAR